MVVNQDLTPTRSYRILSAAIGTEGKMAEPETYILVKRNMNYLLEHENILILFVIPIFIAVLLVLVPGDLHYWTTYWWIVPIALMFAIIVNMLGISGASLFVPFFAIIFPLVAFRLAPTESVMLGLITESFGIGSSSLAFIRFGLVDKKIALYSLAGGVPAVIIASSLAFLVPESMFYFIISAALIVSVYSISRAERGQAFESERKTKESLTVTHHHAGVPEVVTMTDRTGKTYTYCRCKYRIRLVGHTVGGLLQGLTGFGIGELGIVSMILSGIPAKIGVGSNHLIVAITAVIASGAYLVRNVGVDVFHVPWNIIMMTVPAVIIGGQLAPVVAARLDTRLLERVLMVLFVILAIALVYIGLR